MAVRPKIFYLESSIIKNLYTNGKEYMLVNGTEYIGYYHKYNDGLVMTGPTYDINTSEYLVPYRELAFNIYDTITKVSVKDKSSPLKYFLIPTDDDYNLGYVTRYFLRKSNDINGEIIEVSSNTFNSWSSNFKIDNSIYIGVTINWRLTGTADDVSTTNMKSIKDVSLYMPTLSNYLNNTLEFYKNL